MKRGTGEEGSGHRLSETPLIMLLTAVIMRRPGISAFSFPFHPTKTSKRRAQVATLCHILLASHQVALSDKDSLVAGRVLGGWRKAETGGFEYVAFITERMLIHLGRVNCTRSILNPPSWMKRLTSVE